MRKYRPFLVIVNLVIFTIIGIDVALHVFDVWGAHAYFDDLHILFNAFEEDAVRVHRITPGVYQFSNWSATVLADGTRYLPQSAAAGCTLAVIGDSVTFGHGVNDADTFTALLAQDFPSIRWINGGMEGYNIGQVLDTRRMLAVDGYLYLMINNDAAARINPIYVPKPFYRPSIPLYWMLWRGSQSGGAGDGMDTGLSQDFTAFDADIDTLKEDEQVIVVGFTGNDLPVRADVPTIPHWTHKNSFTDAHPNYLGHQEIAAGLRPYVQALIERVCRN